ncbi:MAG: mobile mystery protein A [Candidatus Dadabacteria bacterium]|nr:mobile mystery protein A [Candidatus Dadabacteria bacterium]
MITKDKLVRDQLDNLFQKLSEFKELKIPNMGWIKAIRTSVGMSGRQLAKRIGVSKQAISKFESEEINGSITIKSMRKIAEGLDCTFVYSIIPKTSLNDIVRKRAEKIARERLSRVHQTMMLEKQDLSEEEINHLLIDEINSIINNIPNNMWD